MVDDADLTEVEPGDDDEDLTYRRVVRTLYLVALALNVWALWEVVKDSPEVQIEIAKAKAWFKRRFRDCEGCARRKAAIRAATNRMLYQATEIVTETDDQPT
jgi:hypothetical protein